MIRLTAAVAASLFLGFGACASTGTTAKAAPEAAAPEAAAPEATAAAPQAAATAAAEVAPAPEFTKMTWAEVETAMSGGAVLVDARSNVSYADGHIAGAVNVPCKADAATYAAALPTEKATQLIFYCGGPACSSSNKGAVAAAGLGYTQVAEYAGGYPEWKGMQK